MKLNKLRVRIGGMLAAVLVLGLGVPVSIVAASAPARAAACDAIYDGTFNGVPKYEIPPGCTNSYISGVHRCQAVWIVPGSGAEAVECADVYATNSGGAAYVRGVGKFYCQVVYTQCLGMHVTIDLAYTNNHDQGFAQATTYTCNPSPGPACPKSGPVNVWSGTAELEDNTAGDSNCMYVYSFVPRDGWNGQPNVMSIQTWGAVHEYTEEDSINAQICFEGVSAPPASS